MEQINLKNILKEKGSENLGYEFTDQDKEGPEQQMKK